MSNYIPAPQCSAQGGVGDWGRDNSQAGGAKISSNEGREEKSLSLSESPRLARSK